MESGGGKKHLMFTYGTLKTGEPNHFFMKERNAKLIGKAISLHKWPLVVATRWRIPFVLYRQGQGQVNYVFVTFCYHSARLPQTLPFFCLKHFVECAA